MRPLGQCATPTASAPTTPPSSEYDLRHAQGRESLHGTTPSARNSGTRIGQAESPHISSAHSECGKKPRPRCRVRGRRPADPRPAVARPDRHLLPARQARRPHRHHPVPQAEHLTLDAPVPPARVLPRQLLHQRTHLLGDRRPTQRARIGPFPLDQAPVPGQRSTRISASFAASPHTSSASQPNTRTMNR
jgi:hypothetical protein